MFEPLYEAMYNIGLGIIWIVGGVAIGAISIGISKLLGKAVDYLFS